MSDPDADPEEPTESDGNERPDEPPETEGDSPTEAEGSDGSEDERPEIEDDERAELDLSGVDLDSVDDEDEGTDGDGDATGSEGDENPASPAQSGEAPEATWGDMYVDVLATVLVSIVDEYGDGSREMDAEEIEDLANQPPIALNEQADRLFEEMGGTKDLPPGQALVIGSATVAGSVLLRETDVAGDIAGELSEKAGESA